MQRDIHRSQNRIESYHQLRAVIASVYGKKQLIGRGDRELEISNQCGRLIANAIFHYNSAIVSKLKIKYEKYINNYDYNKAVFLMSNFNLLDNEFLIIKEDSSYASPISSVFYEFYDNLEAIKLRLQTDNEQIQCIVSNNLIENSVAFGQTQKPNLWDYADNVDTIKFLISL